MDANNTNKWGHTAVVTLNKSLDDEQGMPRTRARATLPAQRLLGAGRVLHFDRPGRLSRERRRLVVGRRGRRVDPLLVRGSGRPRGEWRTVCEVGFNMGHSAILWLHSSDAVLKSFDLGNLPYSNGSMSLVAASYPGRVRHNHTLLSDVRVQYNTIEYKRRRKQ